MLIGVFNDEPRSPLVRSHSSMSRLSSFGFRENDILVPTVNSYLLAGHSPDAELIVYPDAGHGFLFQYPHEFAAEVNRFLGARRGTNGVAGGEA